MHTRNDLAAGGHTARRKNTCTLAELCGGVESMPLVRCNCRLALALACAPLFALAGSNAARAANEDIEFIAEHLAEAPMDQRLASLPIWHADHSVSNWQWQLGGAFSRTVTGSQRVQGPLLSIAAAHPIRNRWSLVAFGFYDHLKFSGSAENRLLQVLFANNLPIALPVEATFGGFGGHLKDLGLGAMLQRHTDSGLLGNHNWLFGLQAQRITLSDYRSTFVIASGAEQGRSGVLDYSGHYNHLSMLLGASWPRSRGAWMFTPHALAAFPFPQRGVVGRIRSAGVDVAGDTDSAGHGKHFGDPYVALGYSVEYLPWHISADIGATLVQRLVEQRVHKGIDQNWLVTVAWNF